MIGRKRALDNIYSKALFALGGIVHMDKIEFSTVEEQIENSILSESDKVTL